MTLRERLEAIARGPIVSTSSIVAWSENDVEGIIGFVPDYSEWIDDPVVFIEHPEPDNTK